MNSFQSGGPGGARGGRGGIRDQVLGRRNLLRGEERKDVRGGDRERVGERDEDGNRGGPKEVPGQVRQALLADVQGAGRVAEGVLPFQPRQGSVRGDVRRRVRAEDDLRQLSLQASRPRQPARGPEARCQDHRLPRPRQRSPQRDGQALLDLLLLSLFPSTGSSLAHLDSLILCTYCFSEGFINPTNRY